MFIRILALSIISFLLGRSMLMAQISGNTITQNQTICAGNTLHITGSLPNGCSGNYQYLWESSIDSINWGTTGFINQDLIDNITQAGVKFYRRIVTDNPCIADTSSVVRITTIPHISNNLIEQGTMYVCVGMPTTINTTGQLPIGGNNQYTYQWESSSDSITFVPIPGQTNSAINYVLLLNQPDSFFIRRSINSYTCQVSYSNIKKIVVHLGATNPPVISNQIVCYGQIPNPIGSIPVTNGSGIYSYQWYEYTDSFTYIGPVLGGVFDSLHFGPVTQTRRYMRFVMSGGCGVFGSIDARIEVNPPISPPTNLMGDTICRPNSGIVRASPGSGANQVRWYDSPSGGNLLGTGDSLVVSPIATTTYYAESYSSPSGCNNPTRMPVTVVVNTIGPPTVPNSTINLCGPGIVTITPTPGAGGNSIRWHNAFTTFLFNSNSISVTISNNTTYWLASWDSIMGCISPQLTGITIRVREPIGDNIISSSQSVCSGATPVMLTGTNPSGGTNSYYYQWQSSTNLTTWTPIFGALNPTYAPPSPNSTVYYRRIVSSQTCPSDTSNVVTITVTPGIGNNVIYFSGLGGDQAGQTCRPHPHQTLPGTVPSGGTGVYTYVWMTSRNNGPWGVVPGITSQNYPTGTVLPDTGAFRYYRIVSSGSCPPHTSNPVLIDVYPQLGNYTASSNQTICSGTAPLALTATIPTGGGGYYSPSDWYSCNHPCYSGPITLTGFSGNIYQPGILFNNAQFIAVSGSICSIGSNLLYITVIPRITQNQIFASQTLCPGASVLQLTGTSPTGGGGSYQYAWLSSNDSINWVSIGHTQSVYTPPPLSQTGYFRRLVSGNGPCPADTSQSVWVNIIPPISNNLAGVSQFLCAGMTPSPLSGTVPVGGSGVYQYQWQSSTDSLIWVSAGDTLLHYTPSVSTGVHWFRRIVASGVCNNDTSAGVRVEFLLPIGNNLISSNQTICTGTSPTTLTGTTPTGGAFFFNYQWQSSANLSTWSNISGAVSSTYTPGIINSITYFRRIYSSPPCPNDTSNVVTITVTPGIGNNIITFSTTGQNQGSTCRPLSHHMLSGTIPSGGIGNYSYVWMTSHNNGPWGIVPGITSQSFPSGHVLPDTGLYRYYRIVSSGNCPPSTSTAVMIRVWPQLGNYSISSNQTICSGTAPLALTATIPTGGSGYYSASDWYSCNHPCYSGPITLTGFSGNIYQPNILYNNAQFTAYGGSVCGIASNVLYITVIPRITQNQIFASQTLCPGASVVQFTGTSPTGGGGSYQYAWLSSNDSINWVSIGHTQSVYTPPPLSQTGYFRRLVSGNGPCPADTSQSVWVNIIPPISNNLAGVSQLLCAGMTPSPLSGSIPNGGSGTYQYQWQSSTDSLIWVSTGDTLQHYTPSVSTGVHWFRRMVSSGVCNSDTSAGVRVEFFLPIGNNLISSNQTICTGTSPVTLSGTTPTGGAFFFNYQWQSSTNLSTWTNISGAVNSTYTPGILNSISYFRRIYSSPPCPNDTSNVVTITVTPGIGNNVIYFSGLGGDQAGQTCRPHPHQTLPGTVPSGGTGVYTYVWMTSRNNGPWGVVPGITSQNYPSGMVLPDTGAFRYYRIVSSGSCPPHTSNPVLIDVYPQLGNYTASSNQTICSGTAPLALTATIPTGGGGFYSPSTWFYCTVNCWQGGPIVPTGFSGSVYQPMVLYDNSQFTAHSGSVCGIATNIIYITVIPRITQNQIFASQTLCPGASVVQFTGTSPTGGGGSYQYTWQSSNDSINWVSIGHTQSVYTPPPLSQTGYFRRLVSGNGPCPADTSQSVWVNIIPPISNNLAGVSQFLCAGMTPSPLSGTVPVGGSGVYQYQWQSSTDSLIWVSTGDTLLHYTPGVSTGVHWFRRIVASGVCNNDTSAGVRVEFFPQAGGNTVLADQTLCSGLLPSLLTGSLPTGGGGVFAYQWESSLNQSVWSPISQASTQHYSPASTFQTTYFRRIVQAGICQTSDTSQVITLTATPGISNNAITYFNGQSFGSTCLGLPHDSILGSQPVGGTGVYTFVWMSSYQNGPWAIVSGSTGSALPGPVVLSDTGVYRYYRIVSSGLCPPSTSTAVTITVYPPIGNYSISMDQTICAGSTPQALSASVPTGGAGNPYPATDWYFCQAPCFVGPVNPTGQSGSVYLPPALYSNTSFQGRITSGCNSLSNVVNITVVQPLGQNQVLSNQTICPGAQSIQLTGSLPTGGSGVYFYTWQSSPDQISWFNLSHTHQDYTTPLISQLSYFRRLVSGAGPCPADTSQTVVVDVIPSLTQNVLEAAQTVCGSTFPSTLGNTQPLGGIGNYRYQWQSSTDSINWTSLLPDTFQQLSPLQVLGATWYRRLVVSGYCPGDTSGSSRVTVYPAIGSNTIASHQSICNGVQAAMVSGSIPSGGSGLFLYQWQSSSNLSVWVNLTGGSQQDYSPGLLSQDVYFRRVISSAFCTGDTSVAVSAEQIPVLGNNLAGMAQYLCQGMNPVPLGASLPTGGLGNYQYQWQSSQDSINWVMTGSTQQDITPDTAFSVQWYRRLVQSGPCVADTSLSVTLRVAPAPGFNQIGSQQTICSGTNPLPLTGTLPGGGGGNYSYQWESSTNNQNWNAIPSATMTNFSSGSLGSSTYFRRVYQAAPCPTDTSLGVMVIVNPGISNNSIQLIGSGITCVGNLQDSVAGSNPVGSTGSYQYQWHTSRNNGPWGAVAGGTNSQLPRSIAIDTGVIRFYRVVYSGNCPPDTAGPVMIQVYPAVSTVIIGTDQTICSGGTPLVLTASIPTGGNGNWTQMEWLSCPVPCTTQPVHAGYGSSFNPGPLTQSLTYETFASAGCSVRGCCVTITVLPQITNNQISASQTVCPSGAVAVLTGSAPTGGGGSFSYQWLSSSDSISWVMTGSTAPSFAPLPPSQTVYYRRLVSESGSPCPVDSSSTVVVNVIPPIGNNLAGQNQWLCTGMQPQAFTGSLPTGGSGIYQYAWLSSSDSVNWVNTGLTQQNLTPLLSGWYRRIVHGGICLSDTSLAVQSTINPPISQNLIGNDQSICQGSTPALLTGSAPSGAFGQYQFSWESSLNLSTWLPVSSGTQLDLQASVLNQSFYFRRIVHSSVCSDTAMPVLILTNNPLSANQIGIDQTICAGSTPLSIMGTLPQGGSGIYDYQWESSQDSVNWVSLSGETQQGLQPTALSTHTYFRRLVNSAPCTAIPSNAVMVYTEPQIGNNSILQAQTICIGTAFQLISGSIPSGGNTQYQYTWQSSLTQNNWQTIAGATLQDLSGYIPLQATYLRRVVSAGACTGNNSGNIRISLQARPGYNLLSSQQNLCSGPGSFLFTGTQPNGGTGSFQYSWEISPDSLSWTSIPGATQVSYSGSIPWTTSYLRRIVSSGICPPDTAGGMLVLIDSLVGNNLIGNSQTICAGTQALLLSGSIPSGSVSPPVYLWQESTDSLNWSNASGAFTLQSYQPPILQGNLYYRRIASRGACPADTTLLLSLNVEPVPGANTLAPDQTICLGAAAALLSGSSPSGGNGVFLFSWESSFDAQNWNAITGASQQNFAPGILPITTYFRRWIYSGVCPPLVSASLIVRVESPPMPNTISTTHTLCSGNNGQWLTGSLPSGGNGMYQYQWQSSSDQLNWQNIPQAIQPDYAPGILNQTLFYRRMLTSGVCTGNSSNEVKISVFPTPDIQVIGLDLCLGTGGYLQAQSSYPGGVWNWSTGGQAAQEWVQPSAFTTYSVSYTLGGCTSAVLQTAVRVFPATVATLNPSGQVPLCPGASLTLTAGGGFQFEWPGHLNYQNELTLNTAGSYTVIVTDINGCKDTATTIVNAVPPMQVQFFVQAPSCHNTLDAFTTVVVNGGLPPYTYIWNTTPAISTSSLTGLNQGSFQVSVRDVAGCEIIRTVTITPPLPLSIQTGGNPVPCSPAGNAGTAWVTANGGTAPYYYLWATTPSQTSATAVGLSAGSYSVSVTDSKGCVTTGMAVLQTEPTPTVITSPDTFVCAGAGGIGIQANASGGIPPYIYYWSQSAWQVSGSISDINSPTPTVNPDTTGWYQVTVTGNNGCTSIADSVFVEVMPLPIADAGMDQFFCEGAPGVFLVGNIPNANGPYTVQWSPSTGLFCDTCLTTYALPTVGTIYTLRVTNTLTGCSSDSTTLNSLSTAVVSILPRPVVSAGRDTAICQGDIAQLAGSASGAGPQYSWHWSPALGLNDSTLQMPLASPPHSMIYSLTIVSNGCESQSDSVQLSVIPVPVVSAGTVLNICRGDSIQLPAILQQGMATVYSWTPASGLNDSTLLRPMASPNANTVYKLQAYHQGCTGLPDSVLVIVHDVPIAEAGSGFLFCANGDSVTLNGSFTGSSVPVRYSWSPAYGLNRTDVLTPRCHPDSSMMYYLRVASGVAPTECSTYDSVMVTIVPGVSAEILNPDTNVICQGQPLFLQASGGIGSASYQWWPSAGLSQVNQSSTYATPQQDVRYFVAVSEGGCTDTAFVDLFVHPKPEASFSISQANGCAPLDIYTQNLSSQALAFEWRVSPGNFYSNEREPKISFPSAGVYSITMIARGLGACADTMTHPLPITIIDNINPIVYSEPQFPVRLSLPHAPVSFVDSTEDAVEWMWDFGDGHNSRDRKTSHAWQKPGTYFVTLQVNNLYGCPGLLSLGPYILEEPTLFIPNVFSPNGDGIHDRFNIEYSGDETFVLKIVDRWGVSLFETFNKEQGWDGRNLQGQELEAGVYFYHCQIGNKAYAGSVTMMR